MSRTPIVRPISWLNAAINVVVLVCFAYAGWLLGQRLGAILGAASYLIVSLSLRKILACHHQKAISHCKRGQYELAIPEFEKSLAFFRKYSWVDDWRALTMLSAAGMCYREMALVSLGFCYGQIGNGVKARSHYELCLQEFPANEMAKVALRLMDAASGRQSDAQTVSRQPPGQIEPNEFELAILVAIAQKEPAIRTTIDQLHVLSRQYTGVGSFTTFLCDESTNQLERRPVCLDSLIRMPDVPSGMCAVLFLRGNQPECLEVCSFGDERWNGVHDGFVIEESVPDSK